MCVRGCLAGAHACSVGVVQEARLVLEEVGEGAMLQSVQLWLNDHMSGKDAQYSIKGLWHEADWGSLRDAALIASVAMRTAKIMDERAFDSGEVVNVCLSNTCSVGSIYDLCSICSICSPCSSSPDPQTPSCGAPAHPSSRTYTCFAAPQLCCLFGEAHAALLPPSYHRRRSHIVRNTFPLSAVPPASPEAHLGALPRIRSFPCVSRDVCLVYRSKCNHVGSCLVEILCTHSLHSATQRPASLYIPLESGCRWSLEAAAPLGTSRGAAVQVAWAHHARCFARQQMNYIFGDVGHSFITDWGVKPPQRPHHRGAFCGYVLNGEFCDAQKWNDGNRTFANTLPGALVGGPNLFDEWTDDHRNYVTSEVALDYNAALLSGARPPSASAVTTHNLWNYPAVVSSVFTDSCQCFARGTVPEPLCRKGGRARYVIEAGVCASSPFACPSVWVLRYLQARCPRLTCADWRGREGSLRGGRAAHATATPRLVRPACMGKPAAADNPAPCPAAHRNGRLRSAVPAGLPHDLEPCLLHRSGCWVHVCGPQHAQQAAGLTAAHACRHPRSDAPSAVLLEHDRPLPSQGVPATRRLRNGRLQGSSGRQAHPRAPLGGRLSTTVLMLEPARPHRHRLGE